MNKIKLLIKKYKEEKEECEKELNSIYAISEEKRTAYVEERTRVLKALINTHEGYINGLSKL
ncbi:MAG: hypothetical protein GY679_01955 [Mycoplasma sp.]|nr:hypothetical protein [Mycoplasma sp.]